MLLTACRGTGHLAEYEYPGRTLAVAWVDAPSPQILTGPYFLDFPDDPVRAVIAAGTRIAKEVSASDARPRLDSASARVDFMDRMGSRTGDRASRYLRTRTIENEQDADFVLEVRMEKYGIDAKDWNAAAHFFVEAEISLIDGATGRLIWDRGVRERDPISPAIFFSHPVRDVVTAASFASLSVDEMVVALERLADYSADKLTDHLRNALDKARGEEE